MALRRHTQGESIKTPQGTSRTRAGLSGVALLAVASLASGLIGGLAAAPTAQAETCNADQTICLLTDSSPQKPLWLPAPVSVRIPAVTTPALGWSRPGVTNATGGFALETHTEDWTTFPPQATWRATLEPGPGTSTSSPADGEITMHVEALPYGSCGPPYNICETISADFPLWVVTPVVDMSGTIRRQGRFFVSTLAFTSRTPVRLEFHSGLLAMRTFPCGKPKPCPELAEVAKFRREVGETGALAPGHHEVMNRIPVKGAKRVCAFKEPCAVYLRAYVLGEPYGLGLGSFERRVRVKVKRGENPGRRRTA